MKSIIRPFFFAALAASVFAFAARADFTSLLYIDENGNTTTTSNEVKLITGGNASLEENNGFGGWYGVMTVPMEDITLNSRVRVEGKIKLILRDNCSLTIKGGLDVPADSSLTIYGQEQGSGLLRAVGANGAGFG